MTKEPPLIRDFPNGLYMNVSGQALAENHGE